MSLLVVTIEIFAPVSLNGVNSLTHNNYRSHPGSTIDPAIILVLTILLVSGGMKSMGINIEAAIIMSSNQM